jgi:hypothetical protein
MNQLEMFGIWQSIIAQRDNATSDEAKHFFNELQYAYWSKTICAFDSKEFQAAQESFNKLVD